jgi:uncharacterized membrane protein
VTGPDGVDVDALAVEVERRRVAWHQTRTERDAALHAFDEANRAEARAAIAYAEAMATYDAHKAWR